MTRPTTMRAITEIPANTPRPMGSTESWVPGSWNLAAALEDAESAAEVAVVVLSSPATEAAEVDVPADAAAADPVLTAPAVAEEVAAADDAVPVAAAVPVPVDPEESAVPATVLVP